MHSAITMEMTGATVHTTTARREWWGWLGSMVWLFFMMYGYKAFIHDGLFQESSSWYPLVFMLVFAAAILAFGVRFQKDPRGLARVAFFTTPAAIMITAVFALLPPPWGSVLYAISPVFMAPALTRRVFGVLRTAGPGKQLTRYMSAITVCVICFTAWLILEPPKEIAFLVPALLAVPAWLGVRRAVALPEEPLTGGAFHVSKWQMLGLAGAFLLLVWLNMMHDIIHTNLLSGGNQAAQPPLMILGFALPPLGFLLFAAIADRGHERAGFLCGMLLFLAGILIATLPGNAEPWLIPLALADGFGGAYAEFFVLTVPIYFLAHAKRPVLAASLGVVANLVHSALDWHMGAWMPASLMEVGPPLLVSAAVTAIAFVVVVYFFFERHREKTLAAALYALLHSEANAPALPAAETPLTSETLPLEEADAPTQPEALDAPDAAQTQSMENAGLTPEEIRIALLLLDGTTGRDISRKLHINAADVTRYEKSIRQKLNLMGDPDPVIAAIVAEYGLTKREVNILQCLRLKMTNAEISAELFLAADTVKVHVRNLMKKLPLESRAEVAGWVVSLGTKTD